MRTSPLLAFAVASFLAAPLRAAEPSAAPTPQDARAKIVEAGQVCSERLEQLGVMPIDFSGLLVIAPYDRETLDLSQLGIRDKTKLEAFVKARADRWRAVADGAAGAAANADVLAAEEPPIGVQPPIALDPVMTERLRLVAAAQLIVQDSSADLALVRSMPADADGGFLASQSLIERKKSFCRRLEALTQ